MHEIRFDTAFERLTGYPAFPWQTRLYTDWFSGGRVPASCNLPTGLGKTSVIAVWLIALAKHPDRLPRRLVYVVNRRTVVDQTTDEIEKLRERIPEVPQLDAALWRLCALAPKGLQSQADRPLAISTLRGQFADNRQWSADPCRPAVICGTVDMIGSRLLFSGYGVGFKLRPLHAGFLGQDAILVHDEAQLEPAFQRLIEDIRDEQEREPAPLGDRMRLKVLEMTATRRGAGKAFGLTVEDYQNDTVKRRIAAPKALHLHENEDKNKLAEKIVHLVLQHKDSGRAVLVFVRKVEDVERIAKKLPKGSFEQLTGTIRGLERDALVRKPIFQRFLPEPSRNKDIVPAEGGVYLVCTSAGEVGVNISADHLVCDLTTFESMAQRFGRVNRFGTRSDSRIDVLHPRAFDEKDAYEMAMKKTLEVLRQLDGVASPAALDKLGEDVRRDAFAPTPILLPTSEILFDAWALTSVRDKLPGRPPVEPWLHGIAEWQPPETQVAWRDEVGAITGDLLTEYQPKDLLEDYPLKPQELLRDLTSRVFDRLKKLEAAPDTPVWLVSDDGAVDVSTLSKVIDGGRDALNHRTVLLPPSAGGLSASGMLDAGSATVNDVADEWRNEFGGHRRRRVWDDDEQYEEKTKGMRLIRRIEVPARDDDEAEGRSWHWFELAAGGESDGSRSDRKPVLWRVHTDDVVSNIGQIVASLPLGDLSRAFIVAAKLHDIGKLRKLFQRILGNTDGKEPLAKSGRGGGRVRELYRHEFGSLIDTRSDSEVVGLGSDLQDLLLHLIAAHHGRGRPHFPAGEAFDPENSSAAAEALAREVPRRFARLQQVYGRWGLAYLESLLRAADYAASANPSEFVEDKQ